MLYYEGTDDSVSFKFYLRKEKIFMKKKSNIICVVGLCLGCALTGIGFGIIISHKAKGGHK